jgi:mono/diheme cytochrome c family protein
MGKTLRFFALTMCLAVCSLSVLANDDAPPASKATSAVTPTTGESWINHLHRSFGDTSMGKTGRLGPPPSGSDEETPGWQMGLLPVSSSEDRTLHGADLYRLNCQGCHGEAGLGAPPEINSLIDPVRSTSASLIVARMKKSGMDMSSAAAGEMARQSQSALLDRLHHGGQDMPSFSQLNDAEVRALIAYLNQLAGVPGAKQLTVTETPVRVGELIVKSTCHICHDATGPNPNAQQLEDGAIPPLETLTTRVDQMELIRKVTSGAPITMGTPATPHRGRMPVFYYLSKSEAADVYLYLTAYPPSQFNSANAAMAGVQQGADGNAAGGTGGKVTPTPPAVSAVAPSGQKAQARTPTASEGMPDWVVTFLLMALSGAVVTVILGGMAFASYELSRLGREGEYHSVVGSTTDSKERGARELVAQ